MRFDHRIAACIMHEDPLVAAGLHAVLGADPEIVVVDALGADGGVRHLRDANENADVIVADYGQALVHAKTTRIPAALNDQAEARMLVLTTRDTELEIRAALQAGVHGYLVQGCSGDEVVRGVKTIAHGVRYFCPTVSQRMADCIAHTALTGRETDVLRFLCDGLSNKVIARKMDVAIGTVKTHLRAILTKLSASSRTHAVLLAAQRGLLNSDRLLAPEQLAAHRRLSRSDDHRGSNVPFS